MKMEKVYEVEFMNYTNAMRNCVSDGSEDLGNIKYVHVGKEAFLIKESAIDYYRQFGGGFRNLKFIGNMEII